MIDRHPEHLWRHVRAMHAVDRAHVKLAEQVFAMYAGAEGEFNPLRSDDLHSDARAKLQVFVIGAQDHLGARIVRACGLIQHRISVGE